MPSAPRVRFAPSPTGYLHIGGARTALFNWLYARHHGGTFILRLEDTDRVRSTEASVRAILDGLRWLGIDWDEGPEVGGDLGPYFQTERLGLYRQYADQLIASGHAYRCFCTKEELDARRADFEKQKRFYKYEGTCRDRTDQPELPFVVRFKMPRDEETVSFTDEVLGPIAKPHSDLDDFVMLRADGIPLYNFGCVVDDHLMEMTHVGRGQEHINSTLPQLMLYQALGWEPPRFAHFPLILGADREKLSKRRHPEADVMLHRDNGVLPEALVNFVVRLGWSHGDDETFTREQLVSWFDFDHVGVTSGVWNPDKLAWLNQHWMKTLPPEVVAERWVPFLELEGFQVRADPRLVPLVGLLAPRAKSLAEMAKVARYFFSRGVEVDPKAAEKHLGAPGLALLAQAKTHLEALADWSPQPIEAVVKAVSEEAQVGMGKVAQPLRVAATGGTASPPIGETLELIGRDEVLRRLSAALARGKTGP